MQKYCKLWRRLSECIVANFAFHLHCFSCTNRQFVHAAVLMWVTLLWSALFGGLLLGVQQERPPIFFVLSGDWRAMQFSCF